MSGILPSLASVPAAISPRQGASAGCGPEAAVAPGSGRQEGTGFPRRLLPPRGGGLCVCAPGKPGAKRLPVCPMRPTKRAGGAGWLSGPLS